MKVEIDIKVEQEKVQGEIRQFTEIANQLQQQSQDAIRQVVELQGQLKLLERLNGKKEKTP